MEALVLLAKSRILKDSWFTERINDSEKHDHKIKRWVVRQKSAHQVIALAESVTYGMCLIIDNDPQSSVKDEFIYHEALVHPPMIAHGNPKNVLVLGGGEGATIREVLKYRSMESVTMVDIDTEVIDFCKEYLPFFSGGAFDDPRTKLVICDARQFISVTEAQYDVIISDLCSPVAGGPAYLLYTQEFYSALRQRLSPGGFFCAQIDRCDLVNMEVGTLIHNTIRSVFPATRVYTCNVPFLDNIWGFCLAAMNPAALEMQEDWINEKLKALLTSSLKFYDAETHRGMFSLPKYLRDEIASQTSVITDSNPVLIHK